MALKRFLLFAGADYYPGGGWNDFRSSYDTLEEARADAERCISDNGDWSQIVDSATGEIVPTSRPARPVDPNPHPSGQARGYGKFAADYL